VDVEDQGVLVPRPDLRWDDHQDRDTGDDPRLQLQPVLGDQRLLDHRFRTEQPPYSILARGIESAVLPTAQRYGMGVLTYGPLGSGWLSGRADPTAGRRAARGPQRFDLTVPGNRAKLAAVEQLSNLATEAGLPLTHLATAFVRSHPAVTSVLIGPRRPEHLQDLLAGAEVQLSEEILDRIDDIVPPGTNLNQADIIAVSPALEDKHLRRR
jgi:aryl-alcohol dehydrogenase-like predicted oxidoreductase